MPDRTIREAIDEAVAVETAEAKMRALVRLRQSVLQERRLLRVLTVLSIIGMCAAIYLGWSARMALAEFEATRAESRVIGCESWNEQQLRSRAGDMNQTRTQFEALASFTGADRTPEQQVRVEAFLEDLYGQQAKASEASYPLRDCSPAGIRAYYEEKP